MAISFHIVEARSAEDFLTARSLIQHYQKAIKRDLCFQGFEKELNTLQEVYDPPRGEFFILIAGDIPCGCVGLREFSEGVAEMKRMFVQPAFSGKGGGRLLADRFLQTARALSYRQIVLDTVPELDRAIRLYRQLGFQEIPPYRFNPDPSALYFGLQL